MTLMGLRITVMFALAAIMLVFTATLAFAPHVARVEIEPSTASPGDEISVFGPNGYGQDSEIVIRWNEPDGEVLATVEPGDGFYAPFGPVDITVPEDAESGQNLIVATQDLSEGEGYVRGLPAFAQLNVVDGAEPASDDDDGGAAASTGSDVEQVSTMVESEPPGAGMLALVGVGTLVVALAVAGLAAKALRRGGGQPTPEATTS